MTIWSHSFCPASVRTAETADYLIYSFSILVQLLQSPPPCVWRRRRRRIPVSLPFCLALVCLRFTATRYQLLLSGRLQLRHSWPPSSSAVCHVGDVQYLGLQAKVWSLAAFRSQSVSVSKNHFNKYGGSSCLLCMQIFRWSENLVYIACLSDIESLNHHQHV